MIIENLNDVKVGGKLKLVEINEEGYLHPETKEALLFLLNRKSPVKVDRIDEYGNPWIRFRQKQENGETVHHCFSVNIDKWRKVIPRKQKGKANVKES